jgi:hypothetical protein
MDATAAVSRIFSELMDGPAPQAGFVLNPGDPGLLRSLAKLNAAQASAMPPNGGASVAAHVDHIRYGLELLNRWSHGENPFADADYSASWQRTTVTDAEWAERLAALEREARAWSEALQKERALNDIEFVGVIASAAHLAYHMGAIRQIDRNMRGPAAQD